MKFILCNCVYGLLITLGSAEYLDNVCQGDRTVWLCVFQGDGIYRGRTINKDVSRISFDRLTNSKIDLSCFPSVNLIFIGSVLFDNSAPCQHIMNNNQRVTIHIGHHGYICYGNDNTPVTTEEPSTTEQALSTSHHYFIDTKGININHFVVPIYPEVGENFTLHCKITVLPQIHTSGLTVGTVTLQRRRDGETGFNDIVIYDGGLTNVKYIDEALNQTTLAEVKFTSSLNYNGLPLVSSKEWTLSFAFINAHCNDSGQYRWVTAFTTKDSKDPYQSNTTHWTINKTDNITLGVHGTFSRTSDSGIMILPGPNLKEGASLQVKCKADVGTHPTGGLEMYYLFPNGTHEPVGINVTHADKSECTLVQEITTNLSAVMRQHNGMRFRCVFSQGISTEFRDSNAINVFYLPSSVHIDKYPDRLIYTEGENVTLNCTADGNPQPTYTWQFPNGWVIKSGQQLNLFKLRPIDGGDYKCIAANGEPNNSSKVQASVQIVVEPYHATTYPFTSHNPTTSPKINTCIDQPGYLCGNSSCDDNHIASVYCKKTCNKCEPPAIIGR